MKQQTRYMVRYCRATHGMRTARFSAYDDAMALARDATWSEVTLTSGNGRGLIGQFHLGKPTPEFAHLDNEVQP